MRFTFQESRIWEAGDPVDPDGEVRIMKGKSEPKARRNLPKLQPGRVWVLIGKRSGSDE